MPSAIGQPFSGSRAATSSTDQRTLLRSNSRVWYKHYIFGHQPNFLWNSNDLLLLPTSSWYRNQRTLQAFFPTPVCNKHYIPSSAICQLFSSNSSSELQPRACAGIDGHFCAFFPLQSVIKALQPFSGTPT
uniref:(northern house mosquito) hypothetical protein n=1 Tax=Culex pipiens TaxID=7175 RepID=A0A8D8AHQ0_CULPI